MIEGCVLSAQIKNPQAKIRSMTFTGENQTSLYNPPSPSIFKKQNKENKTIIENLSPCPLGTNLKEGLNCSIRNFINKPHFELKKMESEQIEKQFDDMTNLRNKMLNKHNKIKNNETMINLLTKIKDTSYEVSKNQFSPSISIYFFHHF